METETESLQTEAESLQSETESLQKETESLQIETESLRTETESLQTETESVAISQILAKSEPQCSSTVCVSGGPSSLSGFLVYADMRSNPP